MAVYKVTLKQGNHSPMCSLLVINHDENRGGSPDLRDWLEIECRKIVYISYLISYHSSQCSLQPSWPPFSVQFTKFFPAHKAFKLVGPSTSVDLKFFFFDLTIVNTINIVTHEGVRAFMCLHIHTMCKYMYNQNKSFILSDVC